MNKLAFITLSLFVTLSSCSKDNAAEEKEGIIKISTSINGLMLAAQDQFEANDVIKVYAYQSGDISKMKINGVDNTYNGIKWSASESMLWEDKDVNYDFLALFPNFTLAGNEFTSKAYALRDKMEDNDLLVATNTGVNAVGVPFEKAGMIDLAFDHIMSKVTVKLTFKTDFEQTPKIAKVVLRAQTGAVINFITKDVAATGELVDRLFTKVGNDYVTIAVPQIVSTSHRLIEIYLEGDNVPYVYITTGETALEPQKHRVFNLTVGADKRIILGEISIIDWGQSDDMSGSAQQ